MTLKTVISNSFDPFLNLSVEDWLFQHCEGGNLVCYLWRNERTVVIGRNQNPYAECNVSLLEKEGGFLMRRATGGGAVYHDVENLNFTFVLPASMADTRRNFKIIAAALATYGIEAEVSGRNDMVAQGRKFSGSAFHKNATAALHHGTIMIKTDIAALKRYLTPDVSKLQKHGVKSVENRVVNLGELADISVGDLIPRIVGAFELEYGQRSEKVAFETLSSRDEVRTRRGFYASDGWRFGRWRDFKATCKGTFDWGSVEVSLTTDGKSVVDCQIASDALDTEALATAKRLIIENHEPTADCLPPIVKDILKLINEQT